MAVNTFPNFSVDPYDFKYVNMLFKMCFNELFFHRNYGTEYIIST
jgi:hypothetical protein